MSSSRIQEDGFAWVGEHGPELVPMPRGGQVIAHSEAAIERTVWTDRSDMTPLGLFHDIVGRHTACGTRVLGHGYIVALSKARDDARQPCAQCWPGGVA